MRISEAFPSKYLKAADLQGRNITVVVDRVEMETIGDDRRPIAYFRGKEKGLVLNKTNSNNIAAVYGDDTDDWQGGELIMYPTMVDYQGKSVEAIRVKVPPQKPAARRQPDPPPYTEAPRNGGGDIDDEIPFAPEWR